MLIALGICAVDQGGRHVDYVTDQIISKLLDVVKRKEKKAGVAIKPFQVTFVLRMISICVFFIGSTRIAGLTFASVNYLIC